MSRALPESTLVIALDDLPMGAVAAAADFHACALPELRETVARGVVEMLVLLFAPADYTHDGWRAAAVAGLAREWAPMRVNALAGGDAEARTAALVWLTGAPGVTGQVLRLACSKGLAKAGAGG